MQLDYQKMLVGQDYDGASVMSGQQKVVAKIIKDKVHFGPYVHCHVHRLNLALVDDVKSVQAAADFFCIIVSLL